MNTTKKIALLIMDGWGLGVKKSSAIENAHVPFYKSLFGKYPQSTLVACGEAVGLPEGQIGNSEVGHLNLGAGRIVYQELQRVNKAIQEKTLLQNPAFLRLISYAKTEKKPIHVLGLVSDGGVHSHIRHLIGLLSLFNEQHVPQVFVHAFTDGRDTDPKSGKDFIAHLQHTCDQTGAKIATVSGRYYAMDRDKRWERVAKAYEVLVHGKGETATSALQAVQTSYEQQRTDEFILPTAIVEHGKPVATIQPGDAVLCFNFRTDRCREITEVLTQQDKPEFGMNALPLHYVTMTAYDKNFKHIDVIFSDENLTNTLGEVLATHGKKQIRIAETEKYPHVTYFFSGGRETPFEGEKRIIVPSPKVATYDLQPEMSAEAITQAILPEIEQQTADFICLNFANSDMVGHTGVWDAVVKAVEKVDTCVERIVQACLENGYAVLLTADHGNADYMINEDGSPNTAHSLNLVPLFFIDASTKPTLHSGKLGDIAPTILSYLGIAIPKEMTGVVLLG